MAERNGNWTIVSRQLFKATANTAGIIGGGVSNDEVGIAIDGFFSGPAPHSERIAKSSATAGLANARPTMKRGASSMP